MREATRLREMFVRNVSSPLWFEKFRVFLVTSVHPENKNTFSFTSDVLTTRGRQSRLLLLLLLDVEPKETLWLNSSLYHNFKQIKHLRNMKQ